MKSAYELAMERLAKQSPTVTLTDEQKREIADIESRARARIAEREIFLKGELERAAASGDFEALAQLERQMASERKAIEAEAEEKKEAVRKRAQGG
jgi:hypothetical protein